MMQGSEADYLIARTTLCVLRDFARTLGIPNWAIQRKNILEENVRAVWDHQLDDELKRVTAIRDTNKKESRKRGVERARATNSIKRHVQSFEVGDMAKISLKYNLKSEWGDRVRKLVGYVWIISNETEVNGNPLRAIFTGLEDETWFDYPGILAQTPKVGKVFEFKYEFIKSNSPYVHKGPVYRSECQTKLIIPKYR